VRVFKVRRFSRLAKKEGIADIELKDIVDNVLEKGIADADLGSGVYKVRMARPGGARGRGGVTFFIDG